MTRNLFFVALSFFNVACADDTGSGGAGQGGGAQNTTASTTTSTTSTSANATSTGGEGGGCLGENVECKPPPGVDCAELCCSGEVLVISNNGVITVLCA